jgi:DNA helicase-2/ATP-dependent DNA helicase PcrA
VVAGAGSGKTRVLTHRIAHLVKDHRVDPFGLLAITFTNKAAGEMAERVGQHIGSGIAAKMWVTTFHKTGVRILRRELGRLGYASSFTIYDAQDSLRVVTQVAKDLGVDERRLAPRGIREAISRAKDEMVDYETYASRATAWPEDQIADVYRGYEDRLRKANALDFDDLIVKTVEVLQLFDGVREHYQHRFAHLLVDEYQDTNRAQYHLVQLLTGPDRNVMVVGDPQQGVYGWRGATIQNILDFEHDHPDAKVVVLDRNYRSTQTILDVANAVIEASPVERRAELWTDRAAGAPPPGGPPPPPRRPGLDKLDRRDR